MHTVSYFTVACPFLLLVYGAFCLSLNYLPIGAYDSVGHYFQIAFVAQIVLSYFQFFAWARTRFAAKPRRRLRFAERAPSGFADKFGILIVEESVKFCALLVVAFLGKAADHCNITYAYTVAAVYALNFLVASLVKFCPFHYKDRFKKFLRNYEIFESHKLPKFTKKTSFNNSVLLDSGATLALSDSPSKPVFNLNSFNEAQLLTHSKQMQSMHLDALEAHNDSLERLYSVSPKNTLHCQLGRIFGKDDGISATYFKDLVENIPAHMESQSFHLNDVHFGGGGGGNFEYLLPDGSNLKFGGGAGFDYKHDSKKSSNHGSCDDPEAGSDPKYSTISNLACKLGKSSPESAPYDCSSISYGVQCNPYRSSDESTLEELKARLTNFIHWFRWMLPMAEREDESSYVSPKALRHSIRKKMSAYTLNSEITSLKSFPGRLYGTMDLESQVSSPCLKTENIHAYYEFARYANLYFDVWSPWPLELHEGVDPAFYQFGTLLLRLPTFYFIIYSTGVCLWQFASTLLLAYPFVASSPSMITFAGLCTILILLKLFCLNYLHNQATCSYRVSLVVELVVNLVLFASVYYYYLGL